MDLAELKARAAAQPMSLGAVPVLQARTIYFDGDGLAYSCAGNDETLLAEARERLGDKVRAQTAVSGSATSTILLTGSGSHKGYRYAVARIKPYQAQRSGSRRPKNWQGLRDLLDEGHYGNRTVSTMTAEADDLFGHHGNRSPENTVIVTQDKDMRMVPGWHMDWTDNRMFFVPPGSYDLTFNDKQYGTKWFWLQMLHGDTADHIPGLPRYLTKDAKGKEAYKQCGEVTAAAMLAGTKSDAEALAVVGDAYRGFYKHRALVEMMEQAILLWMRRDADSMWYDCMEPGGPLYPCRQWHDDDEFFKAYAEIALRISTIQGYMTGTFSAEL